MAVIAPCMEIVKVLLDRGADPNLEDANGCTPLSMIFFPIMFNERHRYRDESQIPRELLMWNDPTGLSGEKGRNDMLVCIGQRLLQGKGRFSGESLLTFSWGEICARPHARFGQEDATRKMAELVCRERLASIAEILAR